MFTVVVSYWADDHQVMAENFAKYIKKGNHHVISTQFSDEEKGSATVTHMVTSEQPETLFTHLENFAQEGLEQPPELSGIFFGECIYYVHAMPVNVTTEQLMYILNVALNNSCVTRTQHVRLRNMYLHERGEGSPDSIPVYDTQAIIQAVNILSKKVLGTELLTTINKQEEVKWPVH